MSPNTEKPTTWREMEAVSTEFTLETYTQLCLLIDHKESRAEFNHLLFQGQDHFIQSVMEALNLTREEFEVAAANETLLFRSQIPPQCKIEASLNRGPWVEIPRKPFGHLENFTPSPEPPQILNP